MKIENNKVIILSNELFYFYVYDDTAKESFKEYIKKFDGKTIEIRNN